MTRYIYVRWILTQKSPSTSTYPLFDNKTVTCGHHDHQGLSVMLREAVTGKLFAPEERHGVDVLAYGPLPPSTRARSGLDTGIHQVGGIAGLGGLHLVRVS